MVDILGADDPVAVGLVAAIRGGDVEGLGRILGSRPGLAAARIRSGVGGESRTLVHVATDWPCHFPHSAATVAALVAAGADVDARFGGSRGETPPHWAASCDDVEVLDALLDGGADIEAAGAVIAGGTALDDAVAFGQWRAARRLVERGASTALWHAAALGLMDRLEGQFAGVELPAGHPWGGAEPPDEVTVAFWCACHGGQRRAAAYLLDRGADLNWVAVWDGLTPLDAAAREGHDDLRVVTRPGCPLGPPVRASRSRRRSDSTTAPGCMR